MGATESPRYRIDPLETYHDRASFSCGVESLDRYIRTQAGQNHRRRVATCFVLTAITGRAHILGYNTLSAASLELADLPSYIAKRLPRYPVVPAALLGRLAADSRYRRQRLGELLLLDAFARVARNEIAAFAVLVDPIDEDAERLYVRYRFRRLSDQSRRMFVPISDIVDLSID